MKPMIRTTCTVLLLSLTIGLFAQSQQTRTVGDFKEIAVQSGIDLFLTQDEDQEVRIVADEDYIDRIITEVRGDMLKIYIEKRSWKNNSWGMRKLEAHVSIDYLRKIIASGGSDVEAKGTWKSDDFSIQTSGGSDLSMDIAVAELDVQCSGGSDIDLSGKVDDLKLQTSGGSDFNGKKLIAKTADIQCSGGSDVYIHVTDELIANASGASDIHYAGNPSRRDVNASSSSDVERY